MKNVQDGSHVYFALDSDVLSNLATIYKLQLDNPNASSTEIKQKIFGNPKLSSVYKNYKFYNQILKMAVGDKIRLLVTPTPLFESKHIDGVMDFIEHFCYLPKVNDDKDNQDALKIRELAQAYCHPYIDKNGQKRRAPLNPKYDAHVEYLSTRNNKLKGFLVPSNDAYVLAEATHYGACLITENAKDLIFNAYNQTQQDSYHYENDRVRGIVEINQQYGYCQTNTTEFFGSKGFIIPRPYSVEGVGKILTYHEDSALFVTSEDENFVLAYNEINSD